MNELLNINSAVAFFFLFFLHGTSIGNGQQGISYNALLVYAEKNYPLKKDETEIFICIKPACYPKLKRARAQT